MKITNPDTSEGRKLALEGMALAGRRRGWAIADGQARFLRHLIATGPASLDAIELPDIDSNQWRGSLVCELADDDLIAVDAVVVSTRKSRHAGLLRRWRCVNRERALERIASLDAWLEANRLPEELTLFPNESTPDAPTSRAVNRGI